MKYINLAVILTILFSFTSISFAVPPPDGMMIDWLEYDPQVQSNERVTVTAQVTNYGDVRRKINLEIGIYEDSIANELLGPDVNIFTVANPLGGTTLSCNDELSTLKRTVELDPGQSQEVPITITAPNPDSVINTGKTGIFATSNWGDSHTVLAGLFIICDGGYVNQEGERGGAWSHSPCGFTGSDGVFRFTSKTGSCGVWAGENIQVISSGQTTDSGQISDPSIIDSIGEIFIGQPIPTPAPPGTIVIGGGGTDGVPLACDVSLAQTNKLVCGACGGKWTGDRGLIGYFGDVLLGPGTEGFCPDITYNNLSLEEQAKILISAVIGGFVYALIITLIVGVVLGKLFNISFASDIFESKQTFLLWFVILFVIFFFVAPGSGFSGAFT